MWPFKKKYERILKKEFDLTLINTVKSVFKTYNASILKEDYGIVGLISFYSIIFKIGKEKIVLSYFSDENVSLFGKKELVDEIADKIDPPNSEFT